MMTTLITTAKAHSFYRGIDDGAPEVEDAEAAFHDLVNNGGDQKKALAEMKIAEAIKQAKSVNGKNLTKEEVQKAMAATSGNFQALLRGLGIKGKDAGKSCPNNCNGHGKCVKGICHCEVGFTGSKDCKKPVSGTSCYTCCAYEALDNCRHLFSSTASNTKEYDACYQRSTSTCLNACNGKDQAQVLSCSHTMERIAEKGGANKLPPAIKKMVQQLENKRVQ